MSDHASILIVDDHAILRRTLKEHLEREPGFRVVGDAGNADEAITRAVELRPDMILMDIDMPGVLAFEAARMIRTRCPHTRVVFLSAFTHDRYIEQALAVEASGYVTKTEPPETVVHAIRSAMTGRPYFSPEIQARIIIDSKGAKLAPIAKSRASMLSDRELEVLRYLARGLSKKEIANLMNLSASTVDGHATRLMNKLDIHDRVELARYAIREGLTEP